MAIPQLPPVLQDVLNPPTLPPAVTPPVTTPGPTTFGSGITQTGEAPWVTQQRNMLLGMADRDQWPDWIRAAYGLPARDPNAAASPFVEQMTNRQRRSAQLSAQGARLRAMRPAAAPVGATPAFLNDVLPAGGIAGTPGAAPGVASPYPVLADLASGGALYGNQAAGGSSAVPGSPAAAIPSINTVAAPPRRSLFS